MQDNQPSGSTQEAQPQPIAASFSAQAIIDQFKAILLSPKVFFANMPLEGGFQQPVIFYAAVAGILSLGTILLKLGQPLEAILGGITLFILAMIGSFIGAAICLGLCRLVGGTGSYEATYRACSYSVAPHIVGWIPFVQVFGVIYSAFLCKLALERAHNLPANRAIAVVAIQVGMIIIAFLFLTFASLAALVSTHNH